MGGGSRGQHGNGEIRALEHSQRGWGCPRERERRDEGWDLGDGRTIVSRAFRDPPRVACAPGASWSVSLRALDATLGRRVVPPRQQRRREFRRFGLYANAESFVRWPPGGTRPTPRRADAPRPNRGGALLAPAASMVAGYIIDGIAELRRRRSGAPAPKREMPHNFVLCRELSPRVKWAFWLSNAPYWALCHFVAKRALPDAAVVPWHECLRPLCSSTALHCACVVVIAVASSAFHGVQLELDKSCACALGFRGFQGFQLPDRAPTRASRNAPARREDPSSNPARGGERATPTRGRRRLVSKLLMCDVLCANTYVLFLMTCVSFAHVVRVSVAPVLCMFVAAQSKRRGRYRTYVVFHSLWHIGSAWAIYQSFANDAR